MRVLYHINLVLRMSELKNFYKKLSVCDMIALTPINKGRFYCRFYAEGLYLDRMFITDVSLQKELVLLSVDGEMINKENVLHLKNRYAILTEATDEEGVFTSLSGD